MKYEVTVTSIASNASLDAFRNAIEDMRFLFKASKLYDTGMANSEEVIRAVEHAMKVCIISEIPVQQHFKAIYVANNQQKIMKDWMLSRLGFALVMLNGDPENPTVGKLQIELVRSYLKGKKHY